MVADNPWMQEEEEKEEKQGRKPEMTERLLKTRTIVLADAITKKLAERVTSQLLLLEQDSATEPVKILINSPGGDVDAGFAIFDMINFVTPSVQCICAGLTASAAVIVLLAADKENRLSLPNSRVLIHQPSTGVRGTTADIEIEANEILKIMQKLNDIISRETGQPLDKVARDTKRNYWMSAEEALKYGLISRIITRRADL